MTRRVAALLAVWVAVGCADPTPEPPRVDSSGFERPVARHIERARRTVAENPDDAGAWGKLGIVFAAHNLTHEALACYEQARRLDDRDYRWPYYAALSSFERGHETMLAHLVEAQRLAPDHAPINIRLADLLVVSHRPDEAERHYRLALETSPDDTHALLGMARVAVARKDWGEARRWAEKSVQARKRHREAWVVLARIYGELDLLGPARDAVRRAAAYRFNTRIRDDEMNRIFAETSTVEVLVAQSLRHLEEHDPDPVVDKMKAALEEDPDDSRFYLLLGRALMMRGDLAAAEQAFEDAAARDPAIDVAAEVRASGGGE